MDYLAIWKSPSVGRHFTIPQPPLGRNLLDLSAQLAMMDGHIKDNVRVFVDKHGLDLCIKIAVAGETELAIDDIATQSEDVVITKSPLVSIVTCNVELIYYKTPLFKSIYKALEDAGVNNINTVNLATRQLYEEPLDDYGFNPLLASNQGTEEKDVILRQEVWEEQEMTHMNSVLITIVVPADAEPNGLATKIWDLVKKKEKDVTASDVVSYI